MLSNLPNELLIEIFKLCPIDSFTALATTCQKFSQTLLVETLWKHICETKMVNVTDNYHRTARKKMTRYWLQPNDQWHRYYCAINQPLTPYHNEFSLMVNYKGKEDHFELGVYESGGMNDMVGFTWGKAIVYCKGTVRLESKDVSVVRLRPGDFITFSANFLKRDMSIYINNKLQLTADVSGWKEIYPAIGAAHKEQIKFYYYR